MRRMPALVLSLVLTGPVYAADPEPAPPRAEPASPGQPAQSAGTGNPKAGRAADVFRPSEDITGDAAVSFPVDI